MESALLTQGALCVSCLTLIGILLITGAFFPESHDPLISMTPRQLLFVGVVSALEAVAWQCETLAVISVGSSQAAMAIATEAPMTTVLAYIILKESLSSSQYFGCLLVFLAAVIACYDGGEVTEGCDGSRRLQDEHKSPEEEQLTLLYDSFESDSML